MAKGHEEVIHKRKLDKKDQLHAPLGEGGQWVCNVASGGHVTGSCWNLRACISITYRSFVKREVNWRPSTAHHIIYILLLFYFHVCRVWSVGTCECSGLRWTSGLTLNYSSALFTKALSIKPRAHLCGPLANQLAGNPSSLPSEARIQIYLHIPFQSTSDSSPSPPAPSTPWSKSVS